MIQVNGTVRMADNIGEDTMTALIAMVTKSRAEDGCLDYSYARDLIDPQTMVVFERWRDQEALEAHFASAHMAEFRAALAATGALVSRDIHRYETDEGQPL